VRRVGGGYVVAKTLNDTSWLRREPLRMLVIPTHQLFFRFLSMAALAVVGFWLVTLHERIQAMNDQQEQLLNHPNWAAPFVPTPLEVVDAMLALAEVRESDTLYDLGSGDGRIIIMAAEKYKATAIGIEFDRDLCKQTRLAIMNRRMEDKVRVIHGDIFQQDLRSASVVTAYLLRKSLEKLAPMLKKQLKPGTRVLTVNDEIAGWNVTKHIAVRDASTKKDWRVFLYLVR
jgi:SAM-dependent methyltransferase